jgi:hypothetical protein
VRPRANKTRKNHAGALACTAFPLKRCIMGLERDEFPFAPLIVRKERAAHGASPVQCETTSLLLLEHVSCGVREVTAFEKLICREF